MFEKGFTFNKSAWHARLMKYTWNLSHRDFDYMCPYFWLSVLNVIIAPVFLPLKFTIQTIIWRFLIKWATVGFAGWCYEGIERSLEAMGDKLDAWAIEQQRKWEAKREREIKEMKGVAMEMLSQVPDKILQIATAVANSNSLFYGMHYNDEIAYKDFLKSKGKKFRKFWNFFVLTLKKDNTISDKIIEEKKRIEQAEYQPSTVSSSIFVVVPETEEQKQDRMEREKKAMEAEEKRKAEKKAKEDEKQRILELRKAEARAKAEEAERKSRLRMERKRNARLRNKQRINKILKIAKPIGTAVIWIVGVSVAIIGIYFLMKGVVWIVEGFGSVKQTTYNSIGKGTVWVLKWLGIIVGGILAIIGIVAGIQYLYENIRLPRMTIPKLPRRAREVIDEEYVREKAIRNLRREESRDRMLEKIGNILSAIGSIFPPIWRMLKYIFKFIFKLFKLILITPFVKIWKGIVVFVQIVKQTYDDNCPPITWKD